MSIIGTLHVSTERGTFGALSKNSDPPNLLHPTSTVFEPGAMCSEAVCSDAMYSRSVLQASIRDGGDRSRSTDARACVGACALACLRC